MTRRSNTLDAVDVYRIVNKAVDAAGGDAAFAARHGLSRQLVHMTTASRRGMSPTVLRACGIRCQVVTEYEMIEGAT